LSILTVAPTLPWHVRGGMEEVTWQTATALHERGHEVTILTTAMDHEAEVYTRKGVEVREMAYVPWWAQRFPEYHWWRFFDTAAHEHAREHDLGADVVHVQSFYADGFLADPEAPPVAATVHGTAYHHDYMGGSREKLIEEKGRYHPRRLLQWLDIQRRTRKENRQLAELDAILPVSGTVVSMLASVPDDDPRLRIVPNGVDPEEFPPVEQARARESLGIGAEERVVLYLGRMDRSKRIGLLLDVAEQVDCQVHVAGQGPDLDRFRALVDERSLDESVTVHGWVSDRKRNQLYAAADLFCLPSLAEAFGMVLLEAMLEGTPAAIRRPWLPEELLGFTVVDDDIVEAVREGLELDPDRKRLRETVEAGYTWDTSAERYEDVFLDLVEE
jgi:glycosyltransferase involved in cell wall biosynthesis